ncbi:hypothetical protein INT47_004919 [Mucor saturninus]|uniref:Secreted protein n=1 Tax=Mucor saturninus TaxID=64648 RepID=A0A8H7R3C1_9FUNG|nr:hypothetical protein INT47_004919 [Mucor saturninus]
MVTACWSTQGRRMVQSWRFAIIWLATLHGLCSRTSHSVVQKRKRLPCQSKLYTPYISISPYPPKMLKIITNKARGREASNVVPEPKPRVRSTRSSSAATKAAKALEGEPSAPAN